MGTEAALIFGSIPYESWAFLAPLANAAVFCADGGVHCAMEAGFSPRYYIGDGDSGGRCVEGAESLVLPTEKDLTDFQAAYELARDRGYEEMYFTACTGGRQDHHLANLQLLETALDQGVSACIVDPWNEIRCCRGRIMIPGDRRFRYFSILPIDRELHGVSIRGAKYPLGGVTVRRGDSLTVSNETVDGPAEITIEDGTAWIIRSERLF